MLSHLKNTVIAGFILFALTSLSIGQTNQVQKISSTTEDLMVNFPDVEGWEKGQVVKYPAAALGYSINYESEEGGRVTVYVYNGGKAKIGSGAKDKVIKEEIDKAKNEIFQVEKMGAYKNVKEHKNETVMLGGENGKVECLHSLLSFTARGDNLSSDIYLFGYKNHFIKLRATRLLEKEGTKNPALITLFAALDKLFSPEETVALNEK